MSGNDAALRLKIETATLENIQWICRLASARLRRLRNQSVRDLLDAETALDDLKEEIDAQASKPLMTVCSHRNAERVNLSPNAAAIARASSIMWCADCSTSWKPSDDR